MITTPNKSPIEVYCEITPNPNSIKFVVNKRLILEGSYEFHSSQEAKQFPIIQDLFTFPFIQSAFISSNFITLNKIDDVDWMDVYQELREFIQEYISNNKPIINKDFETNNNLKSKDENESIIPNIKSNINKNFSSLEKRISDVLEEFVRPAVEKDGGNIELESFKDGKVSLSLKGACSGCPSSVYTLKGYVENLLKEHFPEDIKEVVAK